MKVGSLTEPLKKVWDSGYSKAASAAGAYKGVSSVFGHKQAMEMMASRAGMELGAMNKATGGAMGYGALAGGAYGAGSDDTSIVGGALMGAAGFSGGRAGYGYLKNQRASSAAYNKITGK